VNEAVSHLSQLRDAVERYQYQQGHEAGADDALAAETPREEIEDPEDGYER
jgi:hypothetical protein